MQMPLQQGFQMAPVHETQSCEASRQRALHQFDCEVRAHYYLVSVARGRAFDEELARSGPPVPSSPSCGPQSARHPWQTLPPDSAGNAAAIDPEQAVVRCFCDTLSAQRKSQARENGGLPPIESCII